MREIEIKARVSNKERLLKALDSLGISLSDPKKQHDVVYGKVEGKEFVHGGNWLRVRTENDTKVIFTLKRSVSGELDSIEHEVVVDDADELTAIIRHLDYQLFSDLTKIRQTGHHYDIEICVDEVPRLGTFIEAERLCEEDVDHDVIVSELRDLFSQLGISKAQEETSGYDILMRQLEQKDSSK